MYVLATISVLFVLTNSTELCDSTFLWTDVTPKSKNQRLLEHLMERCWWWGNSIKSWLCAVDVDKVAIAWSPIVGVVPNKLTELIIYSYKILHLIKCHLQHSFPFANACLHCAFDTLHLTIWISVVCKQQTANSKQLQLLIFDPFSNIHFKWIYRLKSIHQMINIASISNRTDVYISTFGMALPLHKPHQSS